MSMVFLSVKQVLAENGTSFKSVGNAKFQDVQTSDIGARRLCHLAIEHMSELLTSVEEAAIFFREIGDRLVDDEIDPHAGAIPDVDESVSDDRIG